MKKLLIAFLALSINLCSINPSAHLLKYETSIRDYFKGAEDVHTETGLDKVDCIYVLNLDKQPQRWVETRDMLKAYGLNVSRFAGINGWEIPPEKMALFWTLNGQNPSSPPLVPGQIGCLLSHLSIIQDAYDRGFEAIWVVEDDIEILKDPHLLSGYIDKINELDPGWDILYTDLNMRRFGTGEAWGFYHAQKWLRKNQEVRSNAWHTHREKVGVDFERIRGRWATTSMIYSRKGMETMLNYFKHVHIFSSIDFDIHFIPGIAEYGIIDGVVSNAIEWKGSNTIFPTD